MIRYSIIIVNFRTSGMVIDCLRTVFESSPGPEFEVIVVDNFSGDDSESEILSRFPMVKWIQMGYNSGFARANNAGIKAATGEVVLLLNSDTLNENNAIGKCFDMFVSSNYSACGIQLLNVDRSPQISGSYFIKGGLNQLMSLPYLGRFIRWMGYTFKVRRTSIPEVKGNAEVDWINGAFLMVKKEAIQKAGMMDEDFFLYFEEIEWCSRLEPTGKMCIYGDLNIIHLQGATTNVVFGSTGQGYYNLYDKKGLQIMVSALLRIRKQYGLAWFFAHLLIYLITIPIFLIGLCFSYGKSVYSFRQLKGYIKNCRKLIGLSGKMISNKPYFYKVL